MRKFLPTIALIIFFTAFLFSTAIAANPDSPWKFSHEQLRPFWQSTIMYGESLLFLADKGASPKALLLFQPTRIVSVCDSSGKITYEPGHDYIWKPGTKEIVLPKGSRIISKTSADLRSAHGTQKYDLHHRDGGPAILFAPKHEYHVMQTMVTYEHKPDAWKGPRPSFAGTQLPRTIKKLSEKRPLKIALLGDSISTGCNSSGWANVPPFQPPYQDLLVMNLEAAYGSKVELVNFAVGGMSTPWGVENIGRVIEAKPDLVILAFGMNDASGRSASDYQAKTRAMVDAVRKALPETEVILVATMLGNKDWIALKQELFPQYSNALAELCGPGVALADMTSVWTELLKHKKDWDMTGNGVNHPNDFGHRVYAQVLSALLINDTSVK
ncbi:MAG: SGNH/GDSL hydrolase family protein [Pirellulales bacterium]|nr:SGNH/GDSL hydrolase family protein [Pirellulales bacterium]